MVVWDQSLSYALTRRADFSTEMVGSQKHKGNLIGCALWWYYPGNVLKNALERVWDWRWQYQLIQVTEDEVKVIAVERKWWYGECKKKKMNQENLINFNCTSVWRQKVIWGAFRFTGLGNIEVIKGERCEV